MIFQEKYIDAPFCEKEVWRYSGYMGIPKEDSKLRELLDDIIKETKEMLTYRVCYSRFEIVRKRETVVEPFATDSRDLKKCLEGCSECIMLAATVGHDIDRLIAKYEKVYPTKALLLQAYGAERVESLLDEFCDDLQTKCNSEGFSLTPRFSPGYGDLPLAIQEDFFRILDINRQLGISLGDNLLMRPSKSVTAIVGLKQLCDTCQH